MSTEQSECRQNGLFRRWKEGGKEKTRKKNEDDEGERKPEEGAREE